MKAIEKCKPMLKAIRPFKISPSFNGANFKHPQLFVLCFGIETTFCDADAHHVDDTSCFFRCKKRSLKVGRPKSPNWKALQGSSFCNYRMSTRLVSNTFHLTCAGFTCDTMIPDRMGPKFSKCICFLLSCYR